MTAPTLSPANVARTKLTRRAREQFARIAVEAACTWLLMQQEAHNGHTIGGLFEVDLDSFAGATNLTIGDCESIERKVQRMLDIRTPRVYRSRATAVHLRNYDGMSVPLSIMFA